MVPSFIGSEIYRNSTYGTWHPLRVPRVSTVMDLCRALGWLPREQYISSPRAKSKALLTWHDSHYVDALQRAEKTQHVSKEEKARFQIGTVSNPVFPEMFKRPATAAGGSILAGELLSHGGIVYNPAGGTHHGMPNRANGFCYLNDPVLAMLSLRRQAVQRLAYVDIDAHHPDGVALAFSGDEHCLMISVHEENLWPKTGQLDDDAGGNAFNLPVPRGFHDAEMAYVCDELIIPEVSAFRPDAIVLQCGADAVADDPLSHLSLSNNAHWNIVRELMPLSNRFLVLGGGGYNPWTVGRLWTGVWGVLNGHQFPERLPSDAESVLRNLEFKGDRRGKHPSEHWMTTLQDRPHFGSIRNIIKWRVQELRSRRRILF
ncbi:MAG: acetoin utilization protein AcuC [Aestuariivita sp.]|nr:acetoin utilization protein AcuC [Aestuariivita sp.]